MWLEFCSRLDGGLFYIQSIHKRIMRFQKLRRNLFLTLHGHNIHHQQQQLSKFLMRYQQFASHAYCGAEGPVSKMASQQGKGYCVLRFEVSRSVITVQHEFRARFRKDAPRRNNITRWYRQFVETGCLCKGKSWSTSCVWWQHWQSAWGISAKSRKSVARASRELKMPKMTVWKVLHVLNRTRCDWCRPFHQQTKWKGMTFARRCSWKWRKMIS